MRLFYNGTKYGWVGAVFFISLPFVSMLREAKREGVGKEKDGEGAGDWTRSLHTQLKESSAQRRSLATCVLTFVFLSVVIHGTMELKAKLAAAPASETAQRRQMGEDCQAGSGGLVFIITFNGALQAGDRVAPC